MSPHAEAYFTGMICLIPSRIIYVPRVEEYLTQQTFERVAKALRVPLTSQEVQRG